jgi:hypothetical protein
VGVGENRSRGGFTDYADIDRPVNSQEMETLLSYAKELGMTRHFTSSCFISLFAIFEPAKFGIFSPLPCILTD